MSPLALMLALCGRHGMSLERCLVRNMPQRAQRWRVASVWKVSLSGWGSASPSSEAISREYSLLWMRSLRSSRSSTSDGL